MRKSRVSRVRKSCVICKKSLIPKTPTVKKLEIAYCQACNRRYHLKCCNPSWVINSVTVRCCAVDIRRHFSIHTQSSYCLSEPTCGEFNRCNDSRRHLFTPPTCRSSRKRSASPPSPSSAQWTKVPCIEESIRQQLPPDSADAHTAVVSPVADINSHIVVRIADDVFGCYHARELTPLSTRTARTMIPTSANMMEVHDDKYKDAPAWFVNYIDEYRNDKVKLSEDIKGLSDRLRVAEASFDNQQKQLNEHDAELAGLKSAISTLPSALPSALPRRHRTFDNCELIVSGIPSPVDVVLGDRDIMKKVLEAIKLPHLHQHLLDTRPWSPASASASPAPGSQWDPALGGVVEGPVNISTRSLVCRFLSESARETITAHSHKLGAFDSHKLFGSEAQVHIFLRPLWPKHFFNLWRKSCEAARKLNYMRPYVHEMQIFMRATRTSAPLSVNDEAQLAKLPPRTVSPS